MASPVYSTRFGSAAGFSGGPTTFYTVPLGYLAVLRTITIIFGNVTISGVDAWVQLTSLEKLARATWFTTLGDPTNNGETRVYDLRTVINESEQLQFQTVAGTVDFAVSGYLLTLP